MGATIMQQAVKFAARLDRTTQMADMFADGLHGMTAASDALKKVMDDGERDVMRFVGETAGCLVEKDIELRGAVEDLDRRIEEIRLQIVMLSGKKEGRDR